MKNSLLFAISTGLIVAAFAGCGEAPSSAIPPVYANPTVSTASKPMRAFRSDKELADYLRKAAQKMARRRAELQAMFSSDAPADTSVAKSVAGVAGKTEDPSESVTNVQHAGVDEGGIVKLHGNHLVVLRRGRLFTVKIGDGELRPISTVDAFGPDIDPKYTWYDEMLVAEDTIAVIGYSYERGGTEVGLFRIDDNGALSYRYTYHLRSNDYYSSRNYASRLIGNKLIFYTPLYLSMNPEDPFQNFPAVRKWHKGATLSEFQRIVAWTNVYRPEREINGNLALHTVTSCDLAGDFKCTATAVLGPPGRVFYVSPQSVYVWLTDWTIDGNTSKSTSMLYRMPLDGSGPSALGVSGSPVDQFSFLESADGHLNVLVRSNANGDGMWAAESAEGEVALLRVALSSFSDGSGNAAASNYRKLIKPEGYTFQNRFVGDYLIYGTGSGWGSPQTNGDSKLELVRWAGGPAYELSLPHGVDRIEVMGHDAVVVGTDGKDLHFSAVRLDDSPAVAFRYTRPNASQGELRSHGFFYKPDGPDSGTLGLPISTPARPGYRHLFEESASILFLRNESGGLREVGTLAARSEGAVNDSCRASCVDWYGNARPLFVRGRLFALLGYELVEGAVAGGQIRELRRVSYAPNRQQVTRR